MNVNVKYLFFLFFLPIFLFYFWSNALPLFVRSSITPVSKNNNTLQCLANELHLLYQDIDKSLFEEHENFEDSLTSYLKRGSKNYFHSSATLPVVVHIVYENGIENLTNEEVEMGLERLNDAFNNRNYYNGGVGVNPDISFCLAQRTPQGLTTNGVTRTISSYTNMIAETEDLELKNLIRWRPQNYINIWLVKEITSESLGSNVLGYAAYPSLHGTHRDGIVFEARYMKTDEGVAALAHELGHYLGLYHTFERGCDNEDCETEGDRICDTPPDNTTATPQCGVFLNSCSTDTQSGFFQDQNDLANNYMDYSRLVCYKAFTAGQVARMQGTLATRRSSLLTSPACTRACSAFVEASFTGTIEGNVDSPISFINTSQNALSYVWKIDGEVFTTDQNFTSTFNEPRDYEITLIATPIDTVCSPDSMSVILNITCGVSADFTTNRQQFNEGEVIILTNITEGEHDFYWEVNGIAASTDNIFRWQSDNIETADIQLVVSVGDCISRARLTRLALNQTDCEGGFGGVGEVELYEGEDFLTRFPLTESPSIYFYPLRIESTYFLQHSLHGRSYFVRNARPRYANGEWFDFTQLFLCGEICNNGIDDDGDGLVDCFDEDCCEMNSCDQHYFNPCSNECTFTRVEPLAAFGLKLKNTIPKTALGTNPLVGDLNGDKIPEIVVKRKNIIVEEEQAMSRNLLIKFYDNEEPLLVETPFMDLASTPAIADVDRDGKGEIYILANRSNLNEDFPANGVVMGDVQRRMIAYEFDNGEFTPIWISDVRIGSSREFNISLADLNQDGEVEILIGGKILSGKTGEEILDILRGTLPSSQTFVAADMLADNACPDCQGLELIGNGRIYSVFIDPDNLSNSHFTEKRSSELHNQNYIAVADADLDGDLDVIFTVNVLTTSFVQIVIWDGQDETDINNIAITGDVNAETPVTIGNLIVGNNALELGIDAGSAYYVFNAKNFQEIWSTDLPASPYHTSAIFYDMNGDRAQEVFYLGVDGLRIFAGNDGRELYVEGGSILQENGNIIPIITNMDGDQEVEILLNNRTEGLGIYTVDFDDISLERYDFPWTPVRPVWNQRYFYNTHINDDLTIPRQLQDVGIADQESGLNGFLSVYGDQYFPATDLSLLADNVVCNIQVDAGILDTFYYYRIEVKTLICNQSENDFKGEVPIRLLVGDQLNEAIPFGENYSETPTYSLNIMPDECQQVQLLGRQRISGLEEANIAYDSLFIALNFDYGNPSDLRSENYPITHFGECDYSNNLIAYYFNIRVKVDLGEDIYICENQTVFLNAGSGFQSYRWPDGSTDSTFTAPGAGIYWVEATDGCGTVLTDSIEVINDPVATLHLGDTIHICNFGESVNIDIQGFERAQWFPNTFLEDCGDCLDFTFVPMDTITYEILASNESGCYSIDTLHIALVNNDLETLDTVVCRNAVFTYDGVEIAANESYTFTYLDQYGCDSILTVNVGETDAEAYYLNQDTTICSNEFITINNQFYPADTVVSFSYQTVEGCDSVITLTINALPAYDILEERQICAGETSSIFGEIETESGIYTANYITMEGCDSVYTVDLEVTEPLEVDFVIVPTCENERTGSIKLSVNGGVPDYSYQWSNGKKTSIINNLSENDYQVTITDAMGCTKELSLTLDTVSPIYIDYELTPITCTGANDARLVIENPPDNIQYILNEGALRDRDELNNLASGNYTFQVVDQYGCEHKQGDFTIVDPPILSLELSPDTLLLLGESTIINSEVNQENVTYHWFPTEGLSCTDCPNPIASPTRNMLYELMVQNQGNCTDIATIAIQIDLTIHLYLPTAFSPNKDGKNDNYRVFAGRDIAEITTLQIFDRWGGEVFSSKNSNTFEWDGRSQGQYVNNGIYIVQVAATRINGEKIIKTENVLVVR